MAAEVERPSGFYSAVKKQRSSSPTARLTYQVAHSAQCKLNLAANRPDRNLRFVLGHAFTLDKVLLRIVEIESQSAKDELDNEKPDRHKSEIEEEDDARAGIGGGAGVRVGETGSLARPQRRISFSNQTKPSDLTGGNGKQGRAKSPPPKKKIPKGYEDAESTDSDEYDDPDDLARALDPKTAVNPPAGADEDVPVDDYDQEEDTSLGLTRFASASAKPPRKRSPSPPPLSESDSEEDEAPPKSPPSFPDDVVRDAMVVDSEVSEMSDIYNTIKGCPCAKDHAVAPDSKGMWEIKTKNEEGKNVRYGVVRV